MKEVTCYRCDLCEGIYDTQEAAQFCEQTHVHFSTLEIINAAYVKNESGEREYPTYLIVGDMQSSGDAAKYQKIEEGSVEDILDAY